jgi:hypothetical protein
VIVLNMLNLSNSWGRRSRDRIVGFTATCAIGAYRHLSYEFEPRSWRLCNKVCQ